MKSQKTSKKVWSSVVVGLALILLTTNPRTALAQQWTTNGNHISNTNSGNVGIGTTSPGSKLTLDAGGTSANTFTIQNMASGGTFNIMDSIIETSRPSGLYLMFINSTKDINLQNGKVFFKGDGNVGIGTTAPTTKLHVAGDGKITGNLTVDGNIAAKYQDVAEWVPASQHMPAGTVVVLDPNKSNQVVHSAQAYDTRVAGVISEQPGIALGESGSNKVLVATTGRVKVKVDATRSPIHIGDLLVTSDIIGMAMKSEPVTIGGVQIHRPGTLIGKALEPLEKGKGEILALLSLQ